MTASTFRAQLRAGCYSVLDTFKTANPTLLAHIYDHTPSEPRTPCAFIANTIPEPTIAHDAATRQRRLVAQVWILNKPISNDQVADEQDVLTDALVDAFTAAPRAASASTLIEPISVEPATFEVGSTVTYAASVINVQGTERVGRL
jgi:hypothetical protein